MAAYDFGKMAGKGNGSSKFPPFDPETVAVVDQVGGQGQFFWKVGELANPADLPTPKGETRIKNPNSTVAVHGKPRRGEEVFFTFTFKDINRQTGEVESLSIQKLPERSFFRLSAIPPKVRASVADYLDGMAHSNGIRNGLSKALINRIVEGEDVSIADSLVGEQLDQQLADILSKDAGDFYEQKASDMFDRAIDEKNADFAKEGRKAHAEADAVRKAGEARSLPKGNPERSSADAQDEQALASSNWQQKEREAIERNKNTPRSR